MRHWDLQCLELSDCPSWQKLCDLSTCMHVFLLSHPLSSACVRVCECQDHNHVPLCLTHFCLSHVLKFLLLDWGIPRSMKKEDYLCACSPAFLRLRQEDHLNMILRLSLNKWLGRIGL